MNSRMDYRYAIAVAAAFAAVSLAADSAISLAKEQVGKPPATFEPMVGTWIVAQDGADKVIMIDGRPWVASKDNPTKLLLQTARKLYGTTNEELMDNAKQFAYYPVAVLKGLDNFSNGSISVVKPRRRMRRAKNSPPKTRLRPKQSPPCAPRATLLLNAPSAVPSR